MGRGSTSTHVINMSIEDHPAALPGGMLLDCTNVRKIQLRSEASSIRAGTKNAPSRISRILAMTPQR